MSQNKSFREFGISSWSIDNRITIFILTAVIVVAGLASFNSLPKENFPEIQWPVIFVSTIYPGTSAGDVENLVTRKIEKEIKGIKGIKEVNSTSIQDFSSIFVEFETDVDLDEAKREVEDAVNRSKSSLPNDLPNDPSVNDINLSEIPIMFLNVSGPFDNVTLKRYAEQLEEAIESELSNSILRVDLVGAPQREVQINVDLYKMEAASIALGDIEQAVSAENVIISGGEIDINNQKVSVRLNAEFTTISQLKNLVIRSGLGNSVYLQDIAEVKDTFRERESYARLNGDPVLTLNVIKKAGENLVDAADDIKVIVADYEQNKFPENLSVTVSVDQSIQTKNTLQELINTIIIGFILVVIVLMFFMGLRDALFVGLAVPLSSFIAFATLPALGFSMNLVVLFSFILAMGIVVDNAIVVIENTYRIFNEEGLPIVQAAKKAAGEVIGPVFSGTLTTVCPFLPLLFWPGPIGEFMSFMPVVMIITLFASLFVAYVINPVFATSFMKKEDPNKPTNHRNVIIYTAGAIAIGLICHLGGIPSFGTFMFFMAGFVLLNAYVLKYVIRWFQQRGIPSLKRGYRNLLAWSLDHTWAVFFGVVSVILVTVISIGVAGLKFIQFPEAEPNQVFVYNELPNGTDIEVTDSVTRILEERVFGVIGKDNPIVRSVVTNVAIGAGNSNSFDQSTAAPHKSKITVEFVGVKDRQDQSTLQYLIDIREAVQGIPGTKITVEQEASGPPGSADVELLVTSEDFDDLMKTSTDLFTFLDSVGIPGVEKLTWDVDEKRPELLINIDREKANQLGILSGQIGSALRTALFGKDISQFRDKEDEYDIILRLQEPYRDDISSLLNMSITFRDMSDGRLKSIPISSVASFSYDESYGGINRTDLKKSVKINSNVLKDEYNVNDVFADMEYWVGVFEDQGRINSGVDIEVGGQTIDQAEQGAFLGTAFLIAIVLIFMILVTQFNSFSNVLIILSQVLLSILGVLLGHVVVGMDFSVVLSGVGMVVLTGIVVNNGIILLDFIQYLRKKGQPLKEAVIEGGSIRFTPVLLTASSTVLGLVPLAISLNINFGTLLSDLNPQIFFGGDSSTFWEPFAWSVIFGLTFATVVTLVIVPVLYYQTKRFEHWMAKLFRRNTPADATEATSAEDYSSSNGNGHHPSDASSGISESDPDPEQLSV